MTVSLPHAVFICLALVLPAFFTSCRSIIAATPQEKSESWTRHSSQWKGPQSFAQHTFPRALQLQDPSTSAVIDHLPLPGRSQAMAALITPDGYALTAAHVLKKPQINAAFFNATPAADGSTPQPLRLSRLSVSLQQKGKPDKSLNFVMVENGRPGNGVLTLPSGGKPARIFSFTRNSKPPVKPLKPQLVEARVVQIFPQHDLALIKFPLRRAAHFDLRQSPLQPGTLLFSPGNSLGYTPGPSAGFFTNQWPRAGDRSEIRSLFTTVPMAPGDSGGPVLDANGQLAGIASSTWPNRYFPFLPVSAMAGIPSTIPSIIAADRASLKAAP